MEKFLAYFDILGFKEFIENNTDEHIALYMGNLIRESQSAVSGQSYVDGKPGEYIPDLSKSKIHCIHISDSIIFWSDDTSPESFKNIVECSTYFLRNITQMNFPVRGCIVAGKICFTPFQITNENGITFRNSSIYGKALIDAYIKAEFQEWSGCYIDKTAIEKVDEAVVNKFIYDKKVAYYPVPLKGGTFNYEYAIRIIHSINNDVHFKNLAKQVEGVFFTHMNGKNIPESVKRKMTNTIKFLEHFREKTIANEK